MIPTATIGPPRPDVLSEWSQRPVKLRQDGTSPAPHATVVHSNTSGRSSLAVLYIHGFVDYFFQTHHAQVWQDAGFDFYALDLRDYGRSIQPGRDPNWVTDLTTYEEEITATLTWLKTAHDTVILMGHSTGGLITCLYAHNHPHLIDGVVLNSPWFDLNEPWLTRMIVAPLVRRFGKLLPRLPVSTLGSAYGRSLHISTGGRWDYNLDWKPLEGFGVYAGWLAAILAGQQQLHRGLNITVPVFLATSATRGGNRKPTRTELAGSDVVLDPAHMWAYGFGLGRDVTLIRVSGGIHDLSLSEHEAREIYHQELTSWLRQRF